MELENISLEELFDFVKEELMSSNHSDKKSFYFKYLYKRLYPEAYKFSVYYGLKHNDILDVIQETFLKVFSYHLSFKKGTAFKPWFFKILYNKINDKLREMKKLNVSDIQEIEFFYGEESKEINSFHNLIDIDGIICKLPKHLKDCLLMYAFQGMDYEEIGRILGISSRQVRNRIKEAVEEISALVEDFNV